ncbi:hypothetical protein CQ12_29020 [Bradyrhizobium jicamae]|uniref:DUF1353 domain-containing protein n=1 Tax=Bradyrhizobium jicamae TaxID=280332 RepID=A0A0R3M7W6_9BRAD|nr:DUF1353 domain-containing protein [Bradyrhizobium jicamae]KRR15994.1 hypothetical protein CQ12_29020 [Bradyrhizobium jicamae]
MKAKLLLAIFTIGVGTLAIAQENFGRFENSPKLEFVVEGPGKGRDMRLLEDFTYIDPGGGEWTAKKEFQTNGASIPQVFWSFVGGPFDGPYRSAAIIHDWFCDKKDRRWQDVHRVFYYASRAAGVGEIKAKILYAAVMFGGPRWGKGKSQCYASCHGAAGMTEERGVTVLSPTLSKEGAQEIVDWVKKENPSLDDIDRRTKLAHGLASFE